MKRASARAGQAQRATETASAAAAGPAARPGAPVLPEGVDLSPEALARRMLERHRATIRVKKSGVAVPRLAQIAQATLTLANKSGFHSMSLRDLSEGTGLSMGALYAYFSSKETLLSMILDTVAEVVEEVLGRPPAGLADPRARLAWLIGAHVALTEAMPDWFTFVYMEAKAFPPQARARAVASEARTEALFAAVIEEGRARGVFQVDDVAMAAALIKPMVQDWYVKRSKYRRRGISPEQFASSLSAFATRALGAG
ncbi:TetR/AcrR family transcriptional regulator [Xanthobacter sp. KR7-225]|uniref:TetR/AcrR family transcriptional regulator n=1 Tax=Xanthobacter sp. KR7-225 TaxID=3156613 RepID=UPI0032B5A95E